MKVRVPSKQVVATVSGLILAAASMCFASSPSPRRPEGRRSPVIKLRISEIMYHPAPGGVEFVELLNLGDVQLSLAGISFTEGIEYTFPPGSRIEAGGYVVLASAEEDFTASYPGVAVAGWYNGRLANSGEHLRLGFAGNAVCSVTYDDSAPWPTTADGLGYSLVLVNPNDHSNDSENWRASSMIGGSPGSEDVDPLIPRVLVNEALTHTDPPFLDAIELYNPGNETADLRGWLLTDDPAQPRKALIPDDERFLLAPGEYAVVDETVFSDAPGSLGGAALPGFLLSSQGGEGVFLFSTDPAGDLSGYAHGYRLEAAENGVSFGRYLSSDGETHFVPQQTVSLGQANAGPKVGPVILTEIFYHPPDAGGIEYVKLKNIGVTRADLWDTAGGNPSHTWSIDGIGFSFPEYTSLEPGAELLVVNSEPTTFRSTYSVDPSLDVYGPFGNAAADATASLSNGGETLTLLRPDTPFGEVVPLVVMDRVRYDDRPPWPDADGNALALSRIDEVSYSNESTTWIARAPCFTSGGCAEVQDPSDQLFDISQLIEVEIELDPADWEVLRSQSRYWFSFVAGDCQASPSPSPFTYFPATVTVDGARIENVGVRKKGFLGSLDEERPSLKIKLDEYVDGRRLLGLRLLTLNNNRQDPTYISQCLGYELMADAGIIVPRCSFARVTVNGQYLGVYTHIESIKESFLQRHYGSARGNLYEGTLADFRDGWVTALERKNNPNDPGRDDIQAVVAALEVEDEQLVAALEEVIDLDLFYQLWAIDVIIANWDGYAGNANNYFVYAVPATGKLSFIPWGLDQVFWEGFEWSHTIGESAVYAQGVIARRLFDYAPTRQRYVDTVRSLLDTVWNEPSLLTRIDQLQAIISPHLNIDPGELDRVLDERTRQFIDNPSNPAMSRRNQILMILDAGPPPLTEPLPDSVCLPQVGTLSGTYTTRWSWDWEDGTGNLELTLFDEVLPIRQTSVVLGIDGENPDTAIVGVVLTMADGAEATLWLQTTPEAFTSGRVNVVEPEGFGWFELSYPPGRFGQGFSGFALNGVVTLSPTSLEWGEVITGTIDLPIYTF